ncbi:MliC family protein [Silvibacterium acidisoli]|uniref:MliC family protein n=1 Tax=Acidobacteriaceae bacterium ZG23-2 TaxID=2883246 RepID=UPI00406C9B42
MRNIRMLGALAFLTLAAQAPAVASSLTIAVRGNQPVSRTRAQYHCDAHGAAMGLPSGTFSVEYINSGSNHLAVVPIHGESQIFANVVSGSGARYASGALIWWTGRAITLSSEGLGEKATSTCEEVR